MKRKVLAIKGIPLHVEVADTEDLRQKGLMDRDALSGDSGMLFVFDKPGQLGFWMKNTRIPLSIAFLSESGEILNIENMYPYDFSTRKSTGDALCAIEVNQGWFKRNGIFPGDVVNLGDIRGETALMSESQIRKIVRKALLG